MTRDAALAGFRSDVRRFAAEELLPQMPEWEAERRLPRTAFESFAGAGFTGLTVPRSLGGQGKDVRYLAVLAEELGRVGATGPCASLATVATVVCPILAEHASLEQRLRWLAPAIAGNMVPAIAVTEPSGGSDLARAVRTTATRSGDGWVLDGDKMLVTNAPIADLLLVLARTADDRFLLGMTLFAVESSVRGVRTTPLEKLGMRSSPMGRIHLDECHVPDGSVVGSVNRGYFHVTDPLLLERLLAVIAGGALASACLHRALAAFGRTSDRSAARGELALLLARVEAGRALAWSVVEELREGRTDPLRVALAKAAVGDLARRATMRCYHLCGGRVDMGELALERVVRDLRATSVAAGTSETMRDLAGTRIVQAAKRSAGIGAGGAGRDNGASP